MTRLWMLALVMPVMSAACTTPPDVSSPEPGAPPEAAPADQPPVGDDVASSPLDTAAVPTAAVPTAAAPEDAPSPGAEAPAGAKVCKASSECGSGEMCLGEEGCDQRWTCVAARPCTRDLVTYCGCDGVAFQSSGTCPGRPYRARGECP